MRAVDIMSRGLSVVTPDQPLSRAAALMRDADIGLLPVVSGEDMHVVGVITDRDITVRHTAECHAGDCPVREHMTAGDVVTVRDTDHIHDVMGRMKHFQLRRIPVVDEAHRLIGLVTQADIALNVAPQEPRAFEQLMEAVSTPAVVHT